MTSCIKYTVKIVTVFKYNIMNFLYAVYQNQKSINLICVHEGYITRSVGPGGSLPSIRLYCLKTGHGGGVTGGLI